MTADHPVIIVGGGPVGLTTALELNHHGVRCVVIEPRVVVEHSRPRAKTTSARTMELLRRWGGAERIRRIAPLSPDWSHRATFAETATGAEITHIVACLGLATPSHVSPERGQQISQGLVEVALRDLIAEREGIDLLLGWTAVEAGQDTDLAHVVIEEASGLRRTLTAEWLVGADGPRSIVRPAMGARYEGESGGRPNVNVSFRSRRLARLIPHPPSIHYWAINPASPGVIGPLDMDGSWWAISTGTARIDSDDEAVAIVRGLAGADIDVEIIATDPWQARMLLADRYRTGRMLLVGDAAHQNPPWGGHGFNTGVGDAVNAAWKIAAVLHGWAPAELLESYETERRPIAAETIRIAARNMATLSIDLAESGAAEDLGARIRREKSPEFHSDGLVFGYAYGPAAAHPFAAGVYTPRVEAGARLPHRLLHGVPVHDLLGREFTALGPAAETAALAAEAARIGLPLHTVADDGPVVLVRPDQHIAWTGARVVDAAAVLHDAVRGFTSVDADVRQESARVEG
ncbi:FAD-dependent monooxygenase [Microbacterium sp. 22242]|uniref:FAD-dependent monooxygenase n=1 Tax=Microbacterium sp. 22242 TaxID=3453896 RepID=UPI003F850725